MLKDSFKVLGFIIRNTREFRNPDCLNMLFHTMVLAKLEYCSVIWFPIYTCHVNDIEKLQRRFLKFLAFKCDGVYPERGVPQNELSGRFGIYDKFKHAEEN